MKFGYFGKNITSQKLCVVQNPNIVNPNNPYFRVHNILDMQPEVFGATATLEVAVRAFVLVHGHVIANINPQ